jgi:ATP-binding cassette subfamily F protein uup
LAPTPPLIALEGARLAFGGQPLFEDLELALARGQRVCLVGRNGSGKSTLLRLLAGEVEADAGRRVLQPGLRIGYLPQDPPLPAGVTVERFVAAGLPSEGEGHHNVAAVLARLELAGSARLETLSGGEGRRAALARALVCAPDVLLLDEPTNHLDLPTIAWLEGELARFRGALLMISHDRAFLTATANATLWLDRGRLHRLDKGFAAFDDWTEELRAIEARALQRLDKTLVQEQRWLARGVTARRRRNQGRLARLGELRRQRASLIGARPGSLEMAAAEADLSGKLVIEAEGLGKSFTGPEGESRRIVENFSTRIRRGDRIGFVGRNGAGKTTLINLLLGRLAADAGELRHGTNLAIEVFDQKRALLDPEASLWRSLCPEGGDSVMVGGRQRHVVAYLRDFLFADSQAKQPVKSLSGGEKNRLALARLLARPSNLLVLDEPTNDLDMDTLDLLVEVLDDYAGTLLLVSHDRDFLDRLCTSVVFLDGRGGAVEYPGGYSDALRQGASLGAKSTPAVAAKPKVERPRGPARKLSYKEQRELEALPATIEALVVEIAELEAKLADPELYRRDPAAFTAGGKRIAEARDELAAAEDRWLALEEKRETLLGDKGA